MNGKTKGIQYEEYYEKERCGFPCFLLVLLPSQVVAQQKIPILIYHSIDEFKGVGSKELYVTPENFEKQMIYLRDHGFTLLTFEKWEDRNKVKKPIFITFDDGYKNNLNAFAIFQKLKSEKFQPSGTIFVLSDFLGRSNRLSPSDLKMMVDSGMISIQSHTATHPDLTNITNFDYELKKAKEKIQHSTGKPVIALAYPYGNTNKKVVEETKKYYRFGLTTTPELFTEKGMKDEFYFLPRMYIKYSTTMEEFGKIVEGE
ncbi:polysaccharide deacetylase family protein [Bacillus coreaensis]